MAVRKPAPRSKPTAAELLLADRIKRLRASDPQIDPTGRYHRDLCELAREVGADPSDVIDEWHERAACRRYLGQIDNAEAERLAYDDTVDRFRRQRSIAV